MVTTLGLLVPQLARDVLDLADGIIVHAKEKIGY